MGKLLVARLQPGSVRHLLPLQLGVGVKAATELIQRSTQYFVDSPLFSEWEMCLVQLDFKNAFNSVNRPKMLQELRSTNPKLSPWVEFTYCKEAPLFIQGGLTITSQEGIQQDDPLAPFSSQSQSIRSSAKSQHSSKRNGHPGTLMMAI